MASYAIDISNFKPFDINVPISVLRDYRDLYNKYADALQRIAEENGMYVLPEPEEGNAAQLSIYDQYQKYNLDFRNISDDFAQGMTQRNAALVNQINRRYGMEAKPIAQAVKDFNTWRDNLDKVMSADSSAIIDTNGISVYNFVGGNRPDLKYRSGEKYMKVGSSLSSGWFKSHPSEAKVFRNVLEGYHERVSGGIDPKEAERIANALYSAETGDSTDRVSQLLNHFKNFIDTDMNGFSTDAKIRGYQALVTGAISGLPETKSELVQARDYVSPFELRKQAFSEWSTRANMALLQRQQEETERHNRINEAHSAATLKETLRAHNLAYGDQSKAETEKYKKEFWQLPRGTMIGGVAFRKRDDGTYITSKGLRYTYGEVQEMLKIYNEEKERKETKSKPSSGSSSVIEVTKGGVTYYAEPAESGKSMFSKEQTYYIKDKDGYVQRYLTGNEVSNKARSIAEIMKLGYSVRYPNLTLSLPGIISNGNDDDNDSVDDISM